MTSTTDDRDLRELILMNPNLHSKRLSEVRFPGDLLVLAIRRNDEVIVPHGTTRLALGDHLTILGDLDVIQAAEEWTSGWKKRKTSTLTCGGPVLILSIGWEVLPGIL